VASDIQDSFVKKLLGLAPDFRTTAHDFPEMAQTARNMWVRGLILRQVGKMYAYDTTSDPDANGSQKWEKPALDAITYDDLLLIHAGDIFPFGGIRGAYKDNPFGYVENEVNQILSPYTNTFASVDAGGTTVTFTSANDSQPFRPAPMRHTAAGCKIRWIDSASGWTPGVWVRVSSIQWAAGSPGAMTATIPTTDITGAAHPYALATGACEMTWLPHYGYGEARNTAGKFVRMYGRYLMFIGNKMPMTVWDGATGERPQRFGDEGDGYDETISYYPYFRWLALQNTAESNEQQAIDSRAAVAYGNYWFGYGAYHSSGVSILRGANAACNFMEYVLLGGTFEVLQPITTTEPGTVIAPAVDPADPEPYCTTAGNRFAVLGTAATWDVNDYNIREGDIFITPPNWTDAGGNPPTFAERLHWPDYSGGWGRNGAFYTIEKVNGVGTQTIKVDANLNNSGTDKKPFAILRKIGGNYVRWCNSKDNGGFTNWNPSGMHDGNYREMGWGDGDILDIKVFAGAAWVFKRDAIGRVSYTGDWNVFRLDFVSDKIGTDGGFNSVVETPRGLFFPHGDDFYMFDGSMASLAQPVATGHKRIFGGWGNSQNVTAYSAGYDDYHDRVVTAALTRDHFDGTYYQHGGMYSLDSGQWVEHTACDTLGDYGYGIYPTLVRSFRAGLDPASAYDELSRQNYVMICTSGSTYAIALYDYDSDAHQNGSPLYWTELPMDIIDWKSMPFDIGFPNYVKELKRMRIQEEVARSTTTVPTFWWNVAVSQDFCLGFANKYPVFQVAKDEPSTTGVRFQVEIRADGGQVAGNKSTSANHVNIPVNQKIATRFTTGNTGFDVDSVAFYGKYNAGTAARARFAIYTDTAGAPNALVTHSSLEISSGGLSNTARWHFKKYAINPTLSANTTYWFCLCGGLASVDVAYTTGAVNTHADAMVGDYLDNPYGIPPSYGNEKLSVFVQSAGNERGAGIGGLALQWEKERLKTKTR